MKLKVLLVDDEKLERILLRKGFDWEENGFEIIGEASSAKEALEFIDHRRPEIVLTDISMPQMDGLELAEQIKKRMPSCHVVIVTGYREFEYARRAVKIGVEDFLLKPVNMDDIETITKKIKEQVQKEKKELLEAENYKKSILAEKDILMESFFQRLVESRIEEEEAIHKLMMYSCDEMLKQCICLNIQVKEETDKKKYDEKIEAILTLIKQKEYEDSVCFVHYMENIILYLLKRTMEEAKEVSILLQKEINSQLGIQNTMGISLVNTGFDGIAKAYLQSKKALSAAVLLGRNRVISYHEYEEIRKQNPDKKDIDWEKFIFSINNCLIDKVEAYIEEYADLIRASKVTDKEYLGLMAMNMLSKAGSTMNKYGEGLTRLLGEDILYEEIKKITTVDEVEAYLKRNIHTIMQYHESRKVKQGNKVVEEALRYIEDNLFDSDLSLKLVASNIYTNESYLSRVFKKETKVSLIEYISKKRIEEAIRLLNTTDYKVYEIAEKIGFKDPHYFSICFKKQTGLTVKEFKKDKYEKDFSILPF